MQNISLLLFSVVESEPFRFQHCMTICLISPPLVVGIVTRQATILISALFLSTLMGGCIGFLEEKKDLDLVVTYASTNGTIVESYEDGERVGLNGVELMFDFSQTTSDAELVRFGVNFLNGTPGTTIEASDGDEVIVEFLEHGLHEIALFALDSDGQQVITTVIIRIELRMNWIETSTYEPLAMPLNSLPVNEGIPPAAIIIESHVENPALIENVGGGQSVDVAWGLIDETNSACQRHEGTVDEGQTISWNTVHFNTYEVHELTIQYEEGQDYLNINQTVFLQYEALETPPTE